MPRWLLNTAWGRQMLKSWASAASYLLNSVWPPSAEQGDLNTTPMLFIFGANDPIMPHSPEESFADLYAQGSCVVLDGGHLDAAKVSPAEYEQAIHGFLESLKEPK